MKDKKKQQKSSTPKQAVNAAPTSKPEVETPQADNKQAEITPPVVAPEPVVATPPPVSTPVPEKVKDETPKKERPISISTVVRKLVIQNPEKTADEISSLLIATGWDAADVEKRKSTLITLRTDALGILKIAKECGWEKK